MKSKMRQIVIEKELLCKWKGGKRCPAGRTLEGVGNDRIVRRERGEGLPNCHAGYCRSCRQGVPVEGFAIDQLPRGAREMWAMHLLVVKDTNYRL
jgi:hypothetical protein